MKVAVIGAGAIGAVTAAYMAKGGVDVTLVCKSRSAADRIKTQGIRITGLRQEQIKLDAVAGIEALKGVYDYCLIVTKAYDLEDAAKRICPHLAPDGLAVSVQNGMCLDLLEKIVGKGRAAACVVSWSCTMQNETQFDFTGEGGYVIGQSSGAVDDKLITLKGLLDFAAPCRVSDKIVSEIFSKLIINSGITCGGAITGQTLGQMLKGKNARAFFIGIVYEDMAVADALGIKIPPFGGKLDYYKFIAGDRLPDNLRRNFILRIIGQKYRRLTSSSLTALRRGRKTEAEFLNGWIARKGHELGIPTPVNDAVVRVVSEIEAGTRAIDPKNLKEIVKSYLLECGE